MDRFKNVCKLGSKSKSIGRTPRTPAQDRLAALQLNLQTEQQSNTYHPKPIVQRIVCQNSTGSEKQKKVKGGPNVKEESSTKVSTQSQIHRNNIETPNSTQLQLRQEVTNINEKSDETLNLSQGDNAKSCNDNSTITTFSDNSRENIEHQQVIGTNILQKVAKVPEFNIPDKELLGADKIVNLKTNAVQISPQVLQTSEITANLTNLFSENTSQIPLSCGENKLIPSLLFKSSIQSRLDLHKNSSTSNVSVKQIVFSTDKSQVHNENESRDHHSQPEMNLSLIKKSSSISIQDENSFPISQIPKSSIQNRLNISKNNCSSSMNITQLPFSTDNKSQNQNDLRDHHSQTDISLPLIKKPSTELLISNSEQLMNTDVSRMKNKGFCSWWNSFKSFWFSNGSSKSLETNESIKTEYVNKNEMNENQKGSSIQTLLANSKPIVPERNLKRYLKNSESVEECSSPKSCKLEETNTSNSSLQCNQIFTQNDNSVSVPNSQRRFSANDRLQQLQSELKKTQSCFNQSSSINDDIEKRNNKNSKESSCSCIKMDVDDDFLVSTINNIRKSSEPEKELGSDFEKYKIVNSNLVSLVENHKNYEQFRKNHLYIVPDTNVFLNDFSFLNDLINSKLCDTEASILYIPYIVLQELDKLKMRNDAISVKAGRAIKFLDENFSLKNPQFRGQDAIAAKHNFINIDNSDDQIINCCLQLKFYNVKFILLTNDINLRNKAHLNKIICSSKHDLETST